jgi:hypothetical protein
MKDNRIMTQRKLNSEMRILVGNTTFKMTYKNFIKALDKAYDFYGLTKEG